MASYNKVQLIGNLTRNPEVRYTPKGSAVCDIGLAINRTFTPEGGEKIEEVTFVDVVLWAKLAELAGKYLAKGRSVFIEGRLQVDTWEDKDTGQKRSRIRVVGEQMQFLGSPAGEKQEPRQQGQQRPTPAPRQQRPAQQPQQAEASYEDGMDDSTIPF
jgi:single-strand DNA-binding protein